MGFVLIQHLAPTHASNLAEILSRSTRMTVMEVRDESRVIPNHVFVIPPDRNMIISGGTLQLRPRESSGLHRSIEYFFRSLAEDQGHKANTLYRRITRRMALQKMEGLKDYARFLQTNPDEVEALHRDILVNVTSFFRNAEVFELLKAKIFPQLFKDRSRHDPVRAWVL